MSLTLLVPDLFPPSGFAGSPIANAPAGRSLYPATPGLDTLLSKGRVERGHGMAAEDWLLDAWQIQGQPVAALRRLAHGRPSDEHTWICADPVHLRVERDHLQLVDDHHFELTAQEAAQLIAALNEHFADDQLHLEALTPTRWVMSIPADAVPEAVPLWRVAGKSIFDHMPRSIGSIDWKALGNEAQMLLFSHPVNEARVERGDLPVSGLWFWGGGALPLQRALAPDRIFTHNELARGLALHGECELHDVPADYSQWQQGESMSLVVLDGLSEAVRSHDPAAWSAELERLEAAWFAPTLQAVWTKQLHGMRAVFPCESTTLYLHAAYADLWKIWRRRKPAASHA